MDQNSRLYVSAVIAAAGKSRRMGAGSNKQHAVIGGIPVLVRAVSAFINCGLVSEIIVVAGEDDVVNCERELLAAFGPSKIKAVVAGGEERQDSVYNGLLNVFTGAGVIVVHDGARPFVRPELIESTINDAVEFGAACAAVPARDTLKIALPEGNFIENTPDREAVWCAQTPQAFRREVIMEAYGKAAADEFKATDDACLAERLGHKVKLTMGAYDNIKITTNEDLLLAGLIAEQEARH